LQTELGGIGENAKNVTYLAKSTSIHNCSTDEMV